MRGRVEQAGRGREGERGRGNPLSYLPLLSRMVILVELLPFAE